MSKRAVHRNPWIKGRQDEPAVAHAPYNFIPLPEKVARVELDELPDHDRYYVEEDRFAGRIHCNLETKTPLFVRGQTPLEEFRKPDVDKKREDYMDDNPNFYRDPRTGLPMIPGSSLRGMLRTIVEIISSGKFGPVSERAVYFRSVAEKTEIRRVYQEIIGARQAGWIVKDEAGFAIRPATENDENTYFKVSDGFAKKNGVKFVSLTDESAYKEQGTQIVDVYFRPGEGDRVEDISPSGGPNLVPAKMVCTGLMKKKRKHWVIPKAMPQKGEKLLRLSETVVLDYLNSITEFQKKGDLDPELGILKDGLPVFYITDEEGEVIAIGHTGNFRLPYRKGDRDKAVRLKDMVPEDLQRESDIDFGEALFGYVKERTPPGKARAYAGRVQVGHAKLVDSKVNPWLTEEWMIPKILSGPKPTSYQQYITQPTPDGLYWKDRDGNEHGRVELAHFGSKPEVAEPRGFKWFWHQGKVQAAEDFQADPKEVEDHPTQYTRICPVKPGVKFEFDVYFENLNEVELGALLWALTLPGDERGGRYHKLGMGKPLGLGSVQITPELHLDDRKSRYESIWDEDGKWACPSKEYDRKFVGEAQDAFESEIIRRIGKPQQDFRSLTRIKMLLEMLSWPGPDRNQIKYMELEAFKHRPVLPDPLHIGGLPEPDSEAKPGRRKPRSQEKSSFKADQQRLKGPEQYEIPDVPEEASQKAKDIYKALFGEEDDSTET